MRWILLIIILLFIYLTGIGTTSAIIYDINTSGDGALGSDWSDWNNGGELKDDMLFLDSAAVYSPFYVVPGNVSNYSFSFTYHDTDTVSSSNALYVIFYSQSNTSSANLYFLKMYENLAWVYLYNRTNSVTDGGASDFSFGKLHEGAQIGVHVEEDKVTTWLNANVSEFLLNASDNKTSGYMGFCLGGGSNVSISNIRFWTEDTRIVSIDYSGNYHTDGVDDQEQINDAGVAIESLSGVVHINTGTYRINKSGTAYGDNYSVNWQPGTIIEGAGKGVTTLKLMDNYQNTSIDRLALIGHDVSSFTSGTLKNMTIDGNWGTLPNMSIVNNTLMYGVKIDRATDTVFENLNITDITSDGIWLASLTGTNITIRNVSVSKVGHDGIRIDYSNNISIIDTYADTIGGNVDGNIAYRFYGIDDFTISNATGIGNSYGINIDATTPQIIQNGIVKYSSFTAHTYSPIQIAGTGTLNNVTFENCVAYDAAYGLFSPVSPVVNIVGDSISELRFESCTIDGSARSGMNISGGVIPANITINNTIISNTLWYAINGNATANYNLFYNNSLGYVSNGTIATNNVTSNPYYYDYTYWDNAVLDTNNFHLNSTNGTWNGTGWEIMSSHSPAIDAGDPTSDYSNEPSPNGSRINIGAYGNTIYASLSESIADTSIIIIPTDSWGMFNNWTAATTFSAIAANESNDVAYSFYNTTLGEWESYYVGYSWNADSVIGADNSVMGFFDAETTITADIITPSSTSLYVGWNMLFVEGDDNETITNIKSNIGVNCTDVWWFNSTAGDYSNTVSDTVQANQGFLTYINTAFTWTRSDL